MTKAMIFQILTWFAFAIAALSFVGAFDTENLLQEASFVRAAILFGIFAIFFHLEQHKS